MNAKLKRLISPDVHDLESFHPEDASEFAFLLQLFVGPDAEEGMESFEVTVCSPKWLVKAYGPEEVVVGRHFLFMSEYNYQRMVIAIEKFLRHCSGSTWNEVATKVSRLGAWEFEDYSE
jgi:hypothetical protein